MSNAILSPVNPHHIFETSIVGGSGPQGSIVEPCTGVQGGISSVRYSLGTGGDTDTGVGATLGLAVGEGDGVSVASRPEARVGEAAATVSSVDVSVIATVDVGIGASATVRVLVESVARVGSAVGTSTANVVAVTDGLPLQADNSATAAKHDSPIQQNLGRILASLPVHEGLASKFLTSPDRV